METNDGFVNPLLEDTAAVGFVGPHSARLWLRTQLPGRLRIRWWPEKSGESAEMEIQVVSDNMCDNTAAVTLPPHSPLPPLTAYRFEITRIEDNKQIGQGRFETAPEQPAQTPDPTTIALFSCNQPFTDHGEITNTARDMLKATLRCFHENRVRQLYMVGDQMYSDFPVPLSLFNSKYFARIAPPDCSTIHDCTSAQIRGLYHRRYRHFFNIPELIEMQQCFPTYPIVDDHDIVDNWGSDPAHQEPLWQSIGEGALLAYYDYQGSRVSKMGEPFQPPLHYIVPYGDIATFVMDLRSNRTAGDEGQLFGSVQKQALSDFLRDNAERRALLIVVSVPVVHLSRTLSRIAARITPSGEDFSDRWSSGGHLQERDWLLRLLHAHQRRHPKQRLVLLGGDIHIGCVHEIAWKDSTPPFYQFVSSAITHTSTLAVQQGAKALIRMNQQIVTQEQDLAAQVRLIKGEAKAHKNPFGGLNFGLLEIGTPIGDRPAPLRFRLYSHDKAEPICVYRSPQL